MKIDFLQLLFHFGISVVQVGKVLLQSRWKILIQHALSLCLGFLMVRRDTAPHEPAYYEVQFLIRTVIKYEKLNEQFPVAYYSVPLVESMLAQHFGTYK